MAIPDFLLPNLVWCFIIPCLVSLLPLYPPLGLISWVVGYLVRLRGQNIFLVGTSGESGKGWGNHTQYLVF